MTDHERITVRKIKELMHAGGPNVDLAFALMHSQKVTRAYIDLLVLITSKKIQSRFNPKDSSVISSQFFTHKSVKIFDWDVEYSLWTQHASEGADYWYSPQLFFNYHIGQNRNPAPSEYHLVGRLNAILKSHIGRDYKVYNLHYVRAIDECTQTSVFQTTLRKLIKNVIHQRMYPKSIQK